MSEVIERTPVRRGLAWFELKQEIEDFLYHEADLLDQRRFTEWLDLLTDDVVYFMPVRRNVKFGQHAERENTRQGEGISWFDEDKCSDGLQALRHYRYEIDEETKQFSRTPPSSSGRRRPRQATRSPAPPNRSPRRLISFSRRRWMSRILGRRASQ